MHSRATLGARLRARISELGIDNAEVARRASTSGATVTNWTRDHVTVENVKAAMLLNIADAVQMDPRELLLGEPSVAARQLQEQASPYKSQDLQPDLLTLAFQLAAEAYEAVRAQGKTLPPSKMAELAKLSFELLEEGLPRAKVLRFVQAAAA